MRSVIGTRERGATLQSSAGYSRNVLWENTNRLLAQAGFVGMKTGTTDAAGACLIAVGGDGSTPSFENKTGPEQQGNQNRSRGKPPPDDRGGSREQFVGCALYRRAQSFRLGLETISLIPINAVKASGR